MLVSDDTGGLNVYLPHPNLLITGDDDAQGAKKKEGEDKEKLDYTGKLLNIPGVYLQKAQRRKKNDDDGGNKAGMSTKDKEIAMMNKFLKKLEKHNKIVDSKE
jgi:hypothetical protein